MYSPAGTAVNVKPPISFERVRRGSPVRLLTSDTSAPETTRPCGSCTLPTIVPVLIWPYPAVAKAAKSHFQRMDGLYIISWRCQHKILNSAPEPLGCI